MTDQTLAHQHALLCLEYPLGCYVLNIRYGGNVQSAAVWNSLSGFSTEL
jgi:hypothetical protein